MVCFAAALFVLTFRTADVVPVSIIFSPEVLDQRMSDIGRYIWQYRRNTIFFVYGDGDASAKGSHHCTSLIVYLLDTLESFEWNLGSISPSHQLLMLSLYRSPSLPILDRVPDHCLVSEGQMMWSRNTCHPDPAIRQLAHHRIGCIGLISGLGGDRTFDGRSSRGP